MRIMDVQGSKYYLTKEWLAEVGDPVKNNRYVVFTELAKYYHTGNRSFYEVPVRYGAPTTDLTRGGGYGDASRPNEMSTYWPNAIGCREFDPQTFRLIIRRMLAAIKSKRRKKRVLRNPTKSK